MKITPIADGLEVLAPAKLNLFLEVLGKRPDGYHEIETLMVGVDLFDTLTFADDPSGELTFRCDDPRLPTGDDNLVVRAARRLQAASGVSRGARIALKKAIPAEAGLAGGSSDAAATLLGLDRLWGLQTPTEQLESLAAELGSDVPFFVSGLPAAICRGRGERVERISIHRPLHFVLICPPFGVSTASVYQRVETPGQRRSIGPVLDALAQADQPPALGPCLFNRLQEFAEMVRPELLSVREALAGLAPMLEGWLMSGSGSAYFGLCRDGDAAERAADVLDPLGLGWVRAVTCGP
jgi:4-diphosphocytidyl-2-C-methyl-D-erythritol kinase